MNYNRQNLVKFVRSSDEDEINGISISGSYNPNLSRDDLLVMADIFREMHPSSGSALFSSDSDDGGSIIVATVTDDLVEKGFSAAELIKKLAREDGGKGGGSATIAQAGAGDPPEGKDWMKRLKDWIQSIIELSQ